jgi:hypothetical protein
MTRRDSRASLNARQNDALTEFGRCKSHDSSRVGVDLVAARKKCMPANRYARCSCPKSDAEPLVRLNSTLCVRIEELLSTLYAETLRRRASEIALAAQLKKEQERSRNILADAEAAIRLHSAQWHCVPKMHPTVQTSNLSEQLGFLRQSLNATPSTPSPTLEPTLPPMFDPNASSQVPRLSRAQASNALGIYADDEVASSPEADDDDVVHVNSPDRLDLPSWAQQPQPPVNYPYYPSTPDNSTPFITPAALPRPEPPGSYFPPPCPLPVSPGMLHAAYGGLPGPPGTQISADYTGYPTSLQGTPLAPLPPLPPPPRAVQHPATAYNAFNQPLPGPNAAYGGPPGPPGIQISADYAGYPTSLQGTPWAPLPPLPPPPRAVQHPATAYNAFNQPLPGPMWSPFAPPPMGPFTPVAAAWPMPPGMSPHSAFAGYTPWQHPTHQPPPIEILGYPGDTAQAASRGTHNVDHVDPFAEGPHCTPYSSPNLNCRFLLTHSVRRTDGPVLEPFLAKIVGATITLNPLLAPPADSQDDYLRWNMLFHTSNCYRTTEPQRSWVKGRNAPATHPRLTHVCIISRAFPWMIYARAHSPKLGVTCGEVLDAVSTSMSGDVPKEEYENMPAGRKREIRKSYRFNRSTDANAPGGRLGEGLKRLDWLSSTSSFGGLVVADDTFVKAHCGDVLPCTFELRCLPSYPLTTEEVRAQQRRLENPPRHRSRSRPANSPQPSPAAGDGTDGFG